MPFKQEEMQHNTVLGVLDCILEVVQHPPVQVQRWW